LGYAKPDISNLLAIRDNIFKKYNLKTGFIKRRRVIS
jgi:hypothetical protein